MYQYRTLIGFLALVCLLPSCAPAFPPSGAEQARPLVREWSLSPDLQVAEVLPGVWLHTSWMSYPGGFRVPSNGLLVLEAESLTLIDTAWGELLTEQLLAWADTTLRRPFARAILTHSHHDRTAGTATLLRRGVPVWAHPMTRRLASEHGLPLPDSLPDLSAAGSAVRLGNMEVFYPGPGHTRDNLMVWIPEAELLFGGCAVRAASATSLGNTAHADLASWPHSIRRAQQRYGGARFVVPGHGSMGGAELLEHTQSLFVR